MLAFTKSTYEFFVKVSNFLDNGTFEVLLYRSVPFCDVFPVLWRIFYMSYEKVKQALNKSIGIKQTTRLVESGKSSEVFVAKDADPRITIKMVTLCKKMGVTVTYVDSMKLLGKACGIDVGTAIAAIVNE
jgi:large subunit ribosomal protein L7A